MSNFDPAGPAYSFNEAEAITPRISDQAAEAERRAEKLQ